MTSIIVGTEELSRGVPLSETVAEKLYTPGVRVPETLTTPVMELTVNWTLDGTSWKVNSALEPTSLSLADSCSTVVPTGVVSTI